MTIEAEMTVPSAQQYAATFQNMSGLMDNHIRMLQSHYHAPQHTVTATQLSLALGYTCYSPSNALYGRLSRLVGEELKYNPIKDRVGTLVIMEKRHGEWHWIMRPEVAQALELLGWLQEAGQADSTETTSQAKLDCEALLKQFSYNSDVRNPPDKVRCGRFCAGWEDATRRGRTYTTSAPISQYRRGV